MAGSSDHGNRNSDSDDSRGQRVVYREEAEEQRQRRERERRRDKEERKEREHKRRKKGRKQNITIQ